MVSLLLKINKHQPPPSTTSNIGIEPQAIADSNLSGPQSFTVNLGIRSKGDNENTLDSSMASIIFGDEVDNYRIRGWDHFSEYRSAYYANLLPYLNDYDNGNTVPIITYVNYRFVGTINTFMPFQSTDTIRLDRAMELGIISLPEIVFNFFGVAIHKYYPVAFVNNNDLFLGIEKHEDW
jgi:hypothetical protein